MPRIEPTIPCRCVTERVSFSDSKPRTFLKVGGDYHDDPQYIIHGYDSSETTYEHVREIITSAENFLGEKSKLGKIVRCRPPPGFEEYDSYEDVNKEKLERVEQILEQFPYVEEHNPTAKWFRDSMSYELFGKREIKAIISQMLARKVGKNNIEFGSATYMHTPSVCVDISEEALMRNPADKRLLCDLNTMGEGMELPFKDNTFDSATMPIIMSYIKDWRGFFEEVQRIIKPNKSSYVVLSQGAGGIIPHEDGVSIFKQSGPAPYLIPYLIELEKLGYEYFVEDVPNSDGGAYDIKIIEFAEKLKQKDRKNFWEDIPTIIEEQKTIQERFKDNVREFYELNKEKHGYDLCFIMWDKNPPVYPFDSKSVEVFIYDHLNPEVDIDKVDFDVTKEFKDYLLEKEGEVFFYPHIWKYVENIEKDVKELSQRVSKPDQFVLSLRGKYLGSTSLTDNFETIRRNFITRLVDKVGLWNTYVGVKTKKEYGFRGNNIIENKFREIYEDSKLRKRIESDTKNPVDLIIDEIK